MSGPSCDPAGCSFCLQSIGTITDEVCDEGGEAIAEACGASSEAAGGDDWPAAIAAGICCGIAAAIGCKEIQEKVFPADTPCAAMFGGGCCGDFDPNTALCNTCPSDCTNMANIFVPFFNGDVEVANTNCTAKYTTSQCTSILDAASAAIS